MFGLPPMPSWDALHPLVVHFPIALLLTAPVFIVVGLMRKSWRSGMMHGALVLMALGTLATYVAVPSGEAAGKLAERTPEINMVLERHESLGETTRTLFSILTLIFGVIVFGQRLFRGNLDRIPGTALNVAFLALYAAGLLVLVNTAHNGGRLVHEFGVRAFMPTAGGAAGSAGTPAVAAEQDGGERPHDQSATQGTED